MRFRSNILIVALLVAACVSTARAVTYEGDFATGGNVPIEFGTYTQAGALVAPSSALAASDFKIYKDNSAAERTSTSGITVTSPFDSTTGKHLINIDLSDNTDVGFYSSGSTYSVWLSPPVKTVDGQAVDIKVATFSINRTQFASFETIITSMGEFSDALSELGDDVAAIATQMSRTVDNTEVVESRIIKLSDRNDGSTVGTKPIRTRIGEPLPWWIDTKPIAGGRWLNDVTAATSSDPSELAVTDTGVNRELAVIWLDTSDAVAGEEYTIVVDIQPLVGQVIKAKITVQIKAD